MQRAAADLNLAFLGTGTSQGVPIIGCDCEVCRSEDPRDKRTRCSLYIEAPETAFVIDTGPDFRTQCLREKVRRVDAVLYTHAHTDHIMGFDDLRAFCQAGRPMPVYGSEQTLRDLERVFVFAFNGENRFPGYVHPAPHVVTAPFRLGATEITPLPVPHGRMTTFGYLLCRDGFRLAAYLTDCKAVPPEVIEQIRGVEHLIVDALRHRPHPTHMNVAEALEVAAAARPGRTWFTHLSHDLGHAATEHALPHEVRLAFDGLRLSL
jgi:phosphoribosyl 1,2-cyclic phosphate phosphodiesterase